MVEGTLEVFVLHYLSSFLHLTSFAYSYFWSGLSLSGVHCDVEGIGATGCLAVVRTTTSYDSLVPIYHPHRGCNVWGENLNFLAPVLYGGGGCCGIATTARPPPISVNSRSAAQKLMTSHTHLSNPGSSVRHYLPQERRRVSDSCQDLEDSTRSCTWRSVKVY